MQNIRIGGTEQEAMHRFMLQRPRDGQLRWSAAQFLRQQSDLFDLVARSRSVLLGPALDK